MRHASPPTRFVTRALGKGWWALLFALHIHPCLSYLGAALSAEATLGGVTMLAGLSLLQAFFLLKMFNAAFLRIGAQREVLIAFWVIAAIFHHNAIGPALEAAAEEPIPVIAVTITISGGVLATSRRIRRRSATLLRRLRATLAAAPNLAVPSFGQQPPVAPATIAAMGGAFLNSRRGPPGHMA